ncbi:hypothetical protein IEQ34_019399 [Dendrobium chrysotoxum]|uniref:Uncharacterized protein n=1 Tax=Dendrobium chrysotoxum TaxID=161865 RepID=A0AAV7FR55_DENCH|nr:hypothetical protein IEQ34_019399 [Dendrobium chrysotoxum]
MEMFGGSGGFVGLRGLGRRRSLTIKEKDRDEKKTRRRQAHKPKVIGPLLFRCFFALPPTVVA